MGVGFYFLVIIRLSVTFVLLNILSCHVNLQLNYIVDTRFFIEGCNLHLNMDMRIIRTQVFFRKSYLVWHY